MTNKIEALSVKDLFSQGKYTIPIYQRNYAWSMEQVDQLIQDVANASSKNSTNNYYVGNLIVDRHNDGVFETIDGQQRLTTLFIILSALRAIGTLPVDFFTDDACIDFEHRDNSRESLRRVFNGEMKEINPEEEESNSVELHILDIYKSTIKELPRLCRECGVNTAKFTSHLLENVIVLRIEVPLGIDKNHYFEVMNSRGVQLEQHEIVKAKLMEKLCIESDRKAFEIIWEACADMDRFVQMNFSANCRPIIFGETWMEYPQTDFYVISRSLNTVSKDNDVEQRSLRSLIDDFNSGKPGNGHNGGQQEKILADDQFYSIINFPSFLLHVLKILRPKSDIAFYDKWLVDTFDEILKKEKDQDKFAKDFASCLLKCRYLLDKYVIKRNKDDIWGIFEMATTLSNGSRHAYPRNTFGNEDVIDSGNEVVLVLSMFHFSTPAMNYKNWLNGALTYLYEATSDGDITMEDYLGHMKSLAKAYMVDWYLCPATHGPIEFMNIIHENNGVPTHSIADISDDELKKIINNGTNVDAFIFNFFDYLIWRKNNRKKEFHFTYRTSVEHFYPQHPTGGVQLNPDGPFLNSFGNLCLISTSMNSKFTNKLPAAKYAEYGDNEKARGLSLKLQEMFDVVERNKATKGVKEEWFEEDIATAETEAISMLREYLENSDKL